MHENNKTSKLENTLLLLGYEIIYNLNFNTITQVWLGKACSYTPTRALTHHIKTTCVVCVMLKTFYGVFFHFLVFHSFSTLLITRFLHILKVLSVYIQPFKFASLIWFQFFLEAPSKLLDFCFYLTIKIVMRVKAFHKHIHLFTSKSFLQRIMLKFSTMSHSLRTGPALVHSHTRLMYATNGLQ